MEPVDRAALAAVTGGATATAVRYTRACADGALGSLWYTGGMPTPQGLGAGCVAGVAGEGAVDLVKYVQQRRAAK